MTSRCLRLRGTGPLDVPIRSRGRPREAFTLVELLVVIVIIALLGALLVPAINNARNSAQSAKCMSNLHQIGVMVEIYCADSGNMLPRNNSWTSGGASWLELLVSQVKGISILEARDAIAKGEVPSHCPVILPGDKDITKKSPCGLDYWINYGVNYVNLGGLFPNPPYSRLKVKNPSKCIYITDAAFSLSNPSWPFAHPSARHHGKANVLWVDGHVTSELQSWLIESGSKSPPDYNPWLPWTE